MITAEQLADNLEYVRGAIAQAAERANRDAQDVTLIAVSKTVSLDLVRIAYNLGVTDFGENRVQDALPKIAEFHPPELHWHMIGHVQSNKASKGVGVFAGVKRGDNCVLAEALVGQGDREGVAVPVLLEVKLRGEASKDGVAEA